uniref:Uncharacterized protein n=1 Tax=Tetraselmis sp. GSL018 TaxID=582737 RepID=A0A061RUS9_9CHLO
MGFPAHALTLANSSAKIVPKREPNTWRLGKLWTLCALPVYAKKQWVAVERQRLETELKLEREERRRERDAFHKCLKMLRQRCDIGEPREG